MSSEMQNYPKVTRRHSIRMLKSILLPPPRPKEEQRAHIFHRSSATEMSSSDTQEDFRMRFSSFEFFQDFEMETAIKLLDLCIMKQMQKGDLVFQQDDNSDDNLYLVIEGILCLRIDGGRTDGSQSIKKFDSAGYECGNVGPSRACGEYVFGDVRFARVVHPFTAVVASNNAAILSLSRRDVALAGLLPAVQCRVPSVIRRSGIDRTARRQVSETPTLTSDLTQLPFLMHLRGHLDVMSLARSLTVQPAAAEHRIVYLQDQFDEAKTVLHIVLEGAVHVYRSANGIVPAAAAALDWDNQVLVEQTLGEQQAVLTPGDAFGGPAYASSCDETLVLAPGAVVATADRATWRPFFPAQPRPALLARAQLLRAGLIRAGLQDPTEAVGQSGRPEADGLVDRLVEASPFFRQVVRDRLARLCDGGGGGAVRLVRIPAGHPLCVQGGRLFGYFAILFGTAVVHSDADELFHPSPDERARGWTQRLASCGGGDGGGEYANAEEVFGPRSCCLLPGDVTFERQLALCESPRYCFVLIRS